MKVARDLLRIGESDLNASRILYDAEQYPQSVLMFQQCTEKTNKAIGLLGGFVKPNQLQGIMHEQVKVYQKAVNKQIQLVEELNDRLEPFHKITNHQVLGQHNFQKMPEELKSGLEAVNILKNTNFSGKELDDLIESFQTAQNFKLKLPKTFNDQLIDQIYYVTDWMAMFGLEGEKQQLEFENWLSSKENQTEFVRLVRKILLDAVDFSTGIAGLGLLAILMNNHSSTPRYPLNGKSPLQVYHKNNPLVKRLPILYELAEKGIKTSKKYSRKWSTKEA